MTIRHLHTYALTSLHPNTGGEWVIAAATYTADSSRLYRNGALVGSKEGVSKLGEKGHEFLLASRQDGQRRDWSGDLAEVLVYRYAHAHAHTHAHSHAHARAMHAHTETCTDALTLTHTHASILNSRDLSESELEAVHVYLYAKYNQVCAVVMYAFNGLGQ